MEGKIKKFLKNTLCYFKNNEIYLVGNNINQKLIFDYINVGI